MKLSELSQKYVEGTLTAAEVEESGYDMWKIRGRVPLELIAKRYAESTFPSEEFEKFNQEKQDAIKILVENHHITQKIWEVLCLGNPDVKDDFILIGGQISYERRRLSFKLLDGTLLREILETNLDINLQQDSPRDLSRSITKTLREVTGSWRVTANVNVERNEVTIFWNV